MRVLILGRGRLLAGECEGVRLIDKCRAGVGAEVVRECGEWGEISFIDRRIHANEDGLDVFAWEHDGGRRRGCDGNVGSARGWAASASWSGRAVMADSC